MEKTHLSDSGIFSGGRALWRVLWAAIALAIWGGLDSPAVAYTIKFSPTVYGYNNTSPGDVSYRLTLPGGSFESTWRPASSCAAPDRPVFYAEVEPNMVYTIRIDLIQGDALCAYEVEYEPVGEICGDTYVNGNWFGSIEYNLSPYVPGVEFSSHSVTFEIRTDTNAHNPLLSWTLKDGEGKDLGKGSRGGTYKLRADGKSSASYTNIDPAQTVSVKIVGDSLGCILTNSTLIVSTNTGKVRVSAFAGSPECIYEEAVFELTRCEPCEGGDCGAFGGTSAGNNSVDFRAGLGWSVSGNSAGYLQLKADAPSTNITFPTGLRYSFYQSDVQVVKIGTNRLRQIKAPEGVVDIVTNSSTKYYIDFYSVTNVLGLEKGLYVVTNSYLKRITVEQGATTNDVKITDSGAGIVHEYNWLGNGWELVSGGGLRKQVKTVTFSETNTLKTVTNIVRQEANAPVFHSVQKYRTNLFSERLVEEIIGTGSNALTNSYTYTANGFVQQANRGDGSWTYNVYDSSDRPITVFSSFQNESVTTNGTLCRVVEHDYSTNFLGESGDDGHLDVTVPRRSIESVKGQEVARSFTVIRLGERLDIRCVSGTNWNSASNLVTTTKYYTNGIHRDRVKSILRADGILEMYLYGPSVTNTTNMVLVGHPDGSGTNIDEGTKTVSVIGTLGQVNSRTVVDVASGITTASETYGYDSANRLTTTTYLDGTTSQASYDCCTLSSTADRDGTTTSYTYDGLKRRLTTAKNGITLSNVYDPAGNILNIVRFGTNGGAITVQTSTYDDAGRLTSAQDALGNETSYTNYLTASGLVKTTTYPNASTRTETYFLDGSVKQVSGNAVHGARYEYGPTNRCTFALEVKVDSGGSDTSERVLRVLDSVGRPIQERFADGAVGQTFYNTNGQIEKLVDPDGVATLFDYSGLGELEYTTVDMDGGGKSLSGTDRIRRTVSDAVYNGTLGANVRRIRTYVWPDSTSTPVLLAQTETSVDGLRTWNTLWKGGTAIVSSMQTVRSGGHRYVTNSAFDGTYTISDFKDGRLLSETKKGSDGVQVSATTYEYDEHGRLKKSIDARNGESIFTYDDADRLESTTTPSPIPGAGGELATWFYYNSMGWATNVLLPPLGYFPVVSTEYHLTGEVATNWGAFAIPVGYTYDYAGRLKTMTTWTNFSTRQGAATTTWNYDGQRGFMTNKSYASANGPSYSYTAAGRLKTRTWARGVTCTYATNAAGDVASTSYSDSTPSSSYTYDRLGRVKQIDQGTNITTLAYDDIGELLGETFNGVVVSNRYNALLLRTNIQLLLGATPQLTNVFSYDAAARMAQVSDPGHSVAYQYEANSSLVSTQLFKQNGTTRMTVTNWWDNLARPAHHVSMPATDTALKHYFGHDGVSQVTEVLRQDTAGWIDAWYSYDELGQLVSAARNWWDVGNTAVAGQQFKYAYDDVGNRRWTASGGNEWANNLRYDNYTANDLNQYTKRTVAGWVNVLGSATNTAMVTVNGQPTYRKDAYFRAELAVNNTTNAVWQGITNIATLSVGTNYDLVTTNSGHIFVPQTPEIFQYDADGNLTGDGRWTITWDAENRPIRMQSLPNAPTGSGLTLDFAYDHRGRRISKVVSNWTSTAVSRTKFVYDDWNLIAELNGTNNAVIRTYMWGTDLSGTRNGAGGIGGLLAVNAGTNGVHFAAHDGKGGNVVALVNAGDGTVSGQYDYGPFGEAIKVEGEMARVNPVRFSSKYWDDETDWLYYGYRYFIPGIATWCTRDLIGEMGGLALYRFVHNDPISGIDPFGLQGFSVSPPNTPSTEIPRGPGRDFIQHYVEGSMKHWPPLTPDEITSINAFHEIGDHLAYGAGKEFGRTGGPWGEFMKRRQVLMTVAQSDLRTLMRQAVADYEESGKTSGSYMKTIELALDEDDYLLQTFNIATFIQTGTYTVCDSMKVQFQHRMYSVVDDMTWKPRFFPPMKGQKTQGWPDIPGALLTGWHDKKWQQFGININWTAPDITLTADGGFEGAKSWPWPQWSELFPW